MKRYILSALTLPLFCAAIGVFLAHYVWAYSRGWSIERLSALNPLEFVSPAGTMTPALVHDAWHYGLQAGMLELTAACILAVCGLGILVWWLSRPGNGADKFLSLLDLVRAGIVNTTGPLFGYAYGRTLHAKEYLATMVSGPSGSGKTASVVIPGLLTHTTDSAIILDMKGDLWPLTSGARQRAGHSCFRFNLGDESGQSHRWNPFASCRPGVHRIDDIDKIATTLIRTPDHGPNMWAQSAQQLFTGLALLLWDIGGHDKLTLGAVTRLANMNAPLHKVIQLILKHPDYKGRITEETTSAISGWAYADADRTRSSVLMELQTSLRVFLNPMLDLVTSECDFEHEDLRERLCSIYLTVKPGDIDRYGPLITLFVDSAVQTLTREEPPKHHRGVTMWLDEFARFPMMTALAGGVSYFRSYKIRLIFLLQTLRQLRVSNNYDQAQVDSLVNDCHFRVIMKPSKEDAVDLARDLGRYTQVHWDPVGGGRRARRREKVEVLTQQELMALKPRDMLYFIAGRPLLAKNAMRMWFKNSRLRKIARAKAVRGTLFTKIWIATDEAFVPTVAVVTKHDDTSEFRAVYEDEQMAKQQALEQFIGGEDKEAGAAGA